MEFSLENMAMYEFQNGATYEKIKAYLLEKYGLKVSNRYISLVKRKCGLEVCLNYILSKSKNSKVPEYPPEKLKHFRMI